MALKRVAGMRRLLKFLDIFKCCDINYKILNFQVSWFYRMDREVKALFTLQKRLSKWIIKVP